MIQPPGAAHASLQNFVSPVFPPGGGRRPVRTPPATREEVISMRKRLIKLTGILLIGGASSIALAMPASALTPATAVSVRSIQSPLVRLAETATGTSTGTSAFVTLTTAAVTAGFGPILLATVVK
jgi:hypothetical protein